MLRVVVSWLRFVVTITGHRLGTKKKPLAASAGIATTAGTWRDER